MMDGVKGFLQQLFGAILAYKSLVIVLLGMTILAGIASPLITTLTAMSGTADACFRGDLLQGIIAIAGFISIAVSAAVGVKDS
jgi:hypothetical protein